MSSAPRTGQAEGGQPSVPPEELPGAGSCPYVLVCVPPDMPTRVVCWLAMAGRWGTWMLLTAAGLETGDRDEWFLPLGRRALFLPRDAPGELLATRVRGVLGCLAELEPGTAQLKAPGLLARQRDEPLFQVRAGT